MSTYTLVTLILSLGGLSINWTLAAHGKEKATKTCVPCKKIKQSRKTKTGYITIPERRASDESIIPSARLFYKRQGCGNDSKPTVVFIHGLGFSSQYWSCQQEALSEHYNTIAFDLRGFGLSETTDPELIAYNYELFTTDIHIALNMFGITNPLWIGHSLGGALGLFYANQYPNELEKLVVISSSPLFIVPEAASQPGCDANCPNFVPPNSPTCWPYPTFTTEQVAAIGALIEEIGYDEVVRTVFLPLYYNEECQEELTCALAAGYQTFLQQGEAVLANVLQNLSDLRFMLPTITIPTLFIAGAHDAVVPPANSAYMFDTLPNANLKTFAAKGHNPHVTDYRRVTCTLLDFISGDDAACCVCPLVKPMNPKKAKK